jgi:predicted NBD/HSP70 family sugar kinase
MNAAMEGAKPAAGYAIGIDIGGTKIAAGLVEFPRAMVTGRLQVPTIPERGAQAVLDDVHDLALQIAQIAPADRRPVGVGIGVPELVDLSGRITSAETIDWREVAVGRRFADFGPLVLESDVRAAAMAEARWGAGRGHRWFAFVSIGTGISSALVLDGRALTGARGNALVLGSGRYSIECPQCGAEFEQHLEGVASGSALIERSRSAMPLEACDSRDLFAAASGGHLIARRIVRSAAEALGSSVAWLVNVTDPEVVVFGGGLALAGEVYWEILERSIRRQIWARSTRTLPLLLAGLGRDSGLVGAAAAAWHRYKLE